MRKDQAVADIALGSTALGLLLAPIVPESPLLAAGLAIGSAGGLTLLRHWLDTPFSLALLTNVGVGLVYLADLQPVPSVLATLLLLAISFALIPSFKSLGRLLEAALEGEAAKDLTSDVVERIYKVASHNGGISSLAHIFQQINQPELGKPVSLRDCGRALKELQELGEAYKLSAEGNVFIFPGITAVNDPLTKSIVELAASTGVVTPHDLILKLNLTPEVAQTALNRLEQFGIVVSKIVDGVRVYTVKGLAKHYPYTERTENLQSVEQILG